MASFSGNVLKILTGNLFAQGLAVMVAPVLTRLFAPEAFGVAALFVSITGVINVVTCLRYELAIVLPQTDEEAANLLCGCLLIVLGAAGSTAISVYFFADYLAQQLNSSELGKYLWLVPLVVFVNGLILALSYWNNRTKQFGRISIIRAVSSVVTQGTKFGAGLLGFISGGVLIWATAFGQFIAAATLTWQIWRCDWRLLRSSVSKDRIVVNLKRYYRFPLYNTWSALLNSASHQLPALMLAYFFSKTVVGYYALGMVVLNTPLKILGEAIAQVFFQKASETCNRNGDVSIVVREVYSRLVSLGLFPIIVLMLVSEDLFVIAFGNRWAEAGQYIQILGPLFYFQFLSSPISTLFAILEKQHYGLFFNILLFGTRIASIIVGGMAGDIRLTLFLFVSTGVACYGFLSFWLISKAGLSAMYALQQIIKFAFYSSPLILVLALAKWSFAVNSINLMLLAAGCLATYFFGVIKQDNEIRKPLKAVSHLFGFLK